MKHVCELCGKESDINFNMPMEISGKYLGMLQSYICIDCMASYDDDNAVARAIISKRLDELALKGHP